MPKGMLRWQLKNRIAMFRVHRGLTQADLATLVKVSRGQLARWESDDNFPTEKMIDRLTHVLNCKRRDLFPFE